MFQANIAENQIHDKASDDLKNLFAAFQNGPIVQLLRFDNLLIIYGNKMCMKYTSHFQLGMIRSRLRLTGRFLMAIRSIEKEITDFASLYLPKYYDSVVAAIKVIAEYDTSTHLFKHPAVASSIVTAVRQIAEILIAEYIKQDDEERQKKTENFLKLFDSDINASILKAVSNTLAKMRRDKDINLPSMEDVKLLFEYLELERTACFERLSQNYSYADWVKLSELTMATIIVFNRRRTGETENIEISNFGKREVFNENTYQQLYSTLSDDSERLADHFRRMKIRGKKGRTVSVLLKPKLNSCIELLMTHRQKARINIANTLLFALPSTRKKRIRHVLACKTLKKFAKACGASNPSSLTGTNLRKQLATVCVSEELNDGPCRQSSQGIQSAKHY